ncbi:uncharacterized protein BDW47DRAFT_97720, partial [Aspergillus candidus]
MIDGSQFIYVVHACIHGSLCSSVHWYFASLVDGWRWIGCLVAWVTTCLPTCLAGRWLIGRDAEGWMYRTHCDA